MSYAEKSMKQVDSSKTKQRTKQYILRPKLHPSGWKLQVQTASGQTLLQITRRSTTPPRYLAQAFPPFEIEPFVIKAMTIGEVQRYSLLEAGHEVLSIRQAASPPVVLLRDAQRQIVARFTPISPEVILLRTDAVSVGRLRFKEMPGEFGFITDCSTIAELRWLQGVILYVIARLEEKMVVPLTDAAELEEEDVEPEAETP